MHENFGNWENLYYMYHMQGHLFPLNRPYQKEKGHRKKLFFSSSKKENEF